MAPFKYSPVQLEENFLDKASIITPKTRNRRNVSLCGVFASIASVSILLVCGGLVGAKVLRAGLQHPAHDIQEIFPKFATVPRIFEDGGRQVGKARPVDWTAILPHGLGFIGVPEPWKYDLPPSLPAEIKVGGHITEVYGMALWHQLHCLHDLRASLLFYRDGIEPSHAMVKNSHVDHCFDYLRQTLECHGDTTVEWGKLYDVEGVMSASVDGYGVTHQCRDYEAIRRWTADGRSTNRTHGEDDYERRVSGM